MSPDVTTLQLSGCCGILEVPEVAPGFIIVPKEHHWHLTMRDYNTAFSLESSLRMPPNNCPKCRQAGRKLDPKSFAEIVDYFRCDGCWHVWAIDKGDPEERLIDITIEARKLN